MIVYKITNLLNKKSYIGITTRTLKKRIKEHIQSKSYIGKSILKNKISNFNIEIIDKASDLKKLNELEIFYIKKENTLHPNGYNLDSGGKNKKPSDKATKKMQKSKKKDKSLDLYCQITKRKEGGYRLKHYTKSKRVHLANFKNKKNCINYYNYCKRNNNFTKFNYPRVSKYKSDRFRLRVTKDGTRKTLGFFKTKKEAYDFYIKEHYNGFNYIYES